MKRQPFITLVACAAAIILSSFGEGKLCAQTARERKAAGAESLVIPDPGQKGDPKILHYIVEGGDTIFVDNIPPAWVFPRGSRVDRAKWRKYVRLVYNFNKVYPYALLGAQIVEEVDFNIEDQHMKRGEKKRYIGSVQNDLLKNFEGAIRKMTISQGQLLMRLIDRETGKTGYEIVKDYRSRFAAGFWQGVAKLFKQNLKSPYDPEGIDKPTEELVKIWESGKWDEFYFSIFFEAPPKAPIPEQYIKKQP